MESAYSYQVAEPSSHLAQRTPSPSIRKTIEYIIENYAEDISLDQLAEHANISKFCLIRNFQVKLGISPAKWLWTFRAYLSRELIDLGYKWDLTDIAVFCGFSSSAHFSRYFKKTFGESPSDYRKKALLGRETVNRSFIDIYEDNSSSARDAYLKMCQKLQEGVALRAKSW